MYIIHSVFEGKMYEQLYAINKINNISMCWVALQLQEFYKKKGIFELAKKNKQWIK